MANLRVLVVVAGICAAAGAIEFTMWAELYDKPVYSLPIQIGTPPQTVNFTLDTSMNEHTAVSANCTTCVDSKYNSSKDENITWSRKDTFFVNAFSTGTLEVQQLSSIFCLPENACLN